MNETVLVTIPHHRHLQLRFAFAVRPPISSSCCRKIRKREGSGWGQQWRSRRCARDPCKRWRNLSSCPWCSTGGEVPSGRVMSTRRLLSLGLGWPKRRHARALRVLVTSATLHPSLCSILRRCCRSRRIGRNPHSTQRQLPSRHGSPTCLVLVDVA